MKVKGLCSFSVFYCMKKKCKLCHVKLGFEKMLEKLRGRPWGWDSFNSGMLSAESKSKGVG